MPHINLDIHHLVSLSVDSATPHLLKAINCPLRYFTRRAVPTNTPPTINITIGPFERNTREGQAVDHRYYVRDGVIDFNESLSGHHFNARVELTPRRTDIRFAHHWRNFVRFPRMAYADLSAWLYVIQPVLRLALAEQGYYLVHAAAMARDGRAVLFAGRGGVHKTSLAIAMIRRGWRYMGDDMVIVGPNQQVLAYPLFAERFAYMLQHCTDERMTFIQKFGQLRALRRGGPMPEVENQALLDRVCVLQCQPQADCPKILSWSRQNLIRSICFSTELEHLAVDRYKQINGRFLEAYVFANPCSGLLDAWQQLEPRLTDSFAPISVEGFAVPARFDADRWLDAMRLT